MSAAQAGPIAAAETTFANAHAHASKVEGMLTSETMMRKLHSDLEEMLTREGREWARLMLEAHLEFRAMAEKPTEVVGADGVERSTNRASERQLVTTLGRVPVPRRAYQAPGTTDLHPMDAVLNLPREMYSHGVRRMVAKECARASYDEVVEIVADYTGVQIGKRQVEELAVRAAQDFDGFYEQRAAKRDPQTDLLVLSTDGKGIAMRHEDLREATRRAAEQNEQKLETRLTPGEKSNRKRMAQVAAIYSIAPFPRSASDVVHSLRNPSEVDTKRPRPTEKRVWASVEKDPRKVIREIFADALKRDPERARRWVVLVDGEPRQLRAVKAEAKRAGVKVTLILDVIHVIEYLWGAARALFGQSNSSGERWVSDRLLALLTGRSGGDVAGTIRWWAARKKLDAAARAAIDTTCHYLSSRMRTRLMHYEAALRDGLPIATGVIEGACRYLVKDRMDRTGARWSLNGAEAVLRLRAVRASGDFDDYWAFHLTQESARNHASRYESATIPDPLPTPKPKLRRVK
ncbi:hypothetical protein BH09MYX1_BH09MYX1_64370 [soil metagenome]